MRTIAVEDEIIIRAKRANIRNMLKISDYNCCLLDLCLLAFVPAPPPSPPRSYPCTLPCFNPSTTHAHELSANMLKYHKCDQSGLFLKGLSVYFSYKSNAKIVNLLGGIVKKHSFLT